MTLQALVPWSKLKAEVALLAAAVAFPVASLAYDLIVGSHNLFQRSGAVMVLFAGLLAYRGLSKYWIKAENSFNRGYWLRTSRNQQIVDLSALVISIVGTAIWGYGDLMYACTFSAGT